MGVNQPSHLLLKMKRMENVGPIQKKKGGLKQKKFAVGQSAILMHSPRPDFCFLFTFLLSLKSPDISIQKKSLPPSRAPPPTP